MSSKTARTASLLALLIAAWVLWSGQFQPLLLVLGAISCLLTAYLTRRMGYFDDNLFALRFGARLFGYWAWLAKEVVRSSIEVARVVVNPRLPISPQIVEIQATASHPVDQAILGNSITLTPGTLALDVHRGRIQVHCLTQAGADDLQSGEMDRRVAALRQG
jgi:multicomponent Na+:H+ antiporter subunit E